MEIIVLVIIIILAIYSILETICFRKLEKELEQSKEYNKALSSLNDNIRGFKHDFSNILTAIGGYIYANDMEGLRKYYSDLSMDCNNLNNLSTLNPDMVNNPAILAILSSKYFKATELGIVINLEVFMDLNILNMNIYEYTRILRNSFR